MTEQVAPICDAGVRRAFDFLGKRWNGIILGTLSGGPVGFADLRRNVGSITDSVLSDRLAELTRAGLVERVVTDTRPPGVSYRLSHGRSRAAADPAPAGRLGRRPPAAGRLLTAGAKSQTRLLGSWGIRTQARR